MHLLILGGGRFVGASAMEAALSRGHAVTVFNRGRARGSWPPGVEWIQGDRQTRQAEAQGLRTRPLAETVADLLEEGIPGGADPRWAQRLTRSREQAVIAAWRARSVQP